jgi:hypothetical protein
LRAAAMMGGMVMARQKYKCRNFESHSGTPQYHICQNGNAARFRSKFLHKILAPFPRIRLRSSSA